MSDCLDCYLMQNKEKIEDENECSIYFTSDCKDYIIDLVNKTRND